MFRKEGGYVDLALKICWITCVFIVKFTSCFTLYLEYKIVSGAELVPILNDDTLLSKMQQNETMLGKTLRSTIENLKC